MLKGEFWMPEIFKFERTRGGMVAAHIVEEGKATRLQAGSRASYIPFGSANHGASGEEFH